MALQEFNCLGSKGKVLLLVWILLYSLRSEHEWLHFSRRVALQEFNCLGSKGKVLLSDPTRSLFLLPKTSSGSMHPKHQEYIDLKSLRSKRLNFCPSVSWRFRFSLATLSVCNSLNLTQILIETTYRPRANMHTHIQTTDACVVYKYTVMHMCWHACTRTCSSMCRCICLCTWRCAHIYIYVCVCACMYV